MIPESTIDQALKDLFGKIEFQAEPAGLYDPLRYMIAIGGKRIRPVLALLGYNLWREKPEDILMPAIGLETYHNYTLLHDDL
ncbi:MAG: polyprenyl synthetase family protein, partial [Candidatus Cryptobacteroides sp.]|nr:polyprenyl synthetase family protein [Candidatus Cryptobacteroides sp.]